MKDEIRDERLRRLLRQADSAEDDAGLTMEEVRDMRRTVLRAIPETSRRWVLSPVLAGVVLAALVAMAVLTMWPRSESTPPSPPARSRIAVKESPPPARPDVNLRATEGVPDGTGKDLVPEGPAAGSPAASAPSGKRTRPPRRSPPEEPDRIAAIEEPRTRQIQFDTPGGTRVIWILTSNSAL